MSFPSWTLSDVITQVNLFLNNDVVSALVMASLALAFIPKIISVLKSLFR